MIVQVIWTGAQTLALREALRLSQEAFAAKAGVSVSAVKKWERLKDGIQLTHAFASFMDTTLETATVAETERFWRTVGSAAPRATGKADDGSDFLQNSADESAELLRWAESSNVGPMSIDDMVADLKAITREYLKTRTRPLFERAHSIRDQAAESLRGRHRPEQSRQLYSIAGWAMTILGWMSVDLGKPGLADKHLRAAWVFADNAGDDDLRAWVRAAQHTAAFWRDDYLQAAALAKDGLDHARSGSAALFLSSAYALDLARAERQRDARSALDLAVDLGARMRESPHPDTMAGPFTCSIERATGIWSDTCLITQDTARSLDYASTAVEGFDHTPDTQRNLGSERMVRCQEVKAFLELGYFDIAAARLSIVAQTPPQHRIGPLLQRVDEISSMAAPFASARGVGEILSTAVEFTRGKSIPELTTAEE